VFRALELRQEHPARNWPPPSEPEAFMAWLAVRENHLEAPARRILPQIGDVLATLQAQQGCRVARMSGSGATCFGLFYDDATCDEAAAAIGRRHPRWWLAVSTIRV
jgi:4-diphosphocytidyl-2-C-methyl-D-erythritol kinase